ncbi:hypothetical protein JJB07_13235 [Tumebacillus sp. ITR2]|uniref:Uncharacterized protein n=1 Tax=Tumebacillus amylolyticus TaxID=2801339 RepID=A0ABS1JBD0_9BACL|nr:hypothetical protein [Tumebacillus amylolyticus]MBL0387597.1 hypothetical protein [Tumebacillus amylolyticus]
MEPSIPKSARSRILWVAVVLCLLAGSAGGYYWWCGQVAVKYDRITNAKRV